MLAGRRRPHPAARQAGNRVVSAPSGLRVLHRRGWRSRLERRGALPASDCGTALDDRRESRRPLRTPGKGSSAPRGCLSVWASRVHTPRPRAGDRGFVVTAPDPDRISRADAKRVRDARHVGHGQPRPAGARSGCPGRPLLALGLARGGVRPGEWPGVDPQPDQRRGQDAATRLLDPQGPGDRILALERVAGDRGRQAARDRGYDGVAAASLHRACCGDAVAGVARRSAARDRRGQPPSESQHRLVWCAIDCPYGARNHHDPRAGSTGTWDRDRDRSAAGHERHGRDG